MAYDPHALTIYIDGSCRGNPGGPGGIAGLVEYPDFLKRDREVIFRIGYASSTNNRMELQACIKALSWAQENAPIYRPPRIVISTDSVYLCENYKRIASWKRNKWRNIDNRPIENSDLWGQIYSLLTRIGTRVDIEWKKGKSTEIGKSVDRIAKKSAEELAVVIDEGFHEGKVSRTKLPGSAAEMFRAKGQEAVVRIYRKKPIRRGKQIDSMIYFELLSDDGGDLIGKYSAYTSPDNEELLHRHGTYRVRFDDNPKYPKILEVIEEVLRK